MLTICQGFSCSLALCRIFFADQSSQRSCLQEPYVKFCLLFTWLFSGFLVWLFSPGFACGTHLWLLVSSLSSFCLWVRKAQLNNYFYISLVLLFFLPLPQLLEWHLEHSRDLPHSYWMNVWMNKWTKLLFSQFLIDCTLELHIFLCCSYWQLFADVLLLRLISEECGFPQMTSFGLCMMISRLKNK